MTIRIRYLDSLRGIAALSVVIFHFIGGFGSLPYIPSWFLRTPFAFFVDGIAAVALFFVLSGFVLTFKAFSKPQSYSLRDSLDVFLIHRVFRILPPFIAWVLISALCQRYLPHDFPNQTSWLRGFWSGPASWGRVLRECFIFSTASGNHLVPQDWSLTFEMNISIFIPLYTLLALAGNFPFYFYLLLRSTKNVFLFHFFLGMIISKNFARVQAAASRLNRMTTFGFFLAGLTLYSFREVAGGLSVQLFSTHSEDAIWLANGIGSFIIICLALGSATFQKILLHSWLTWLGKISYSLYLMHLVILKCVTPLLLTQFSAWWGVKTGVGIWLGLGLTVGICLGLSHFSYFLFEEPFIRLGKILGETWKSFFPVTGHRVAAVSEINAPH